MIAITPQMRILVAVDPVDFRSGIDGLSRLCRQRLKADPFSGCVFVFSNRRRTAVKGKRPVNRIFWPSFWYGMLTERTPSCGRGEEVLSEASGYLHGL